MSVYVSQCSTDKRSLVGHMSTRIIRPANNDFHLANNNIQLVAITAASVSAIADKQTIDGWLVSEKRTSIESAALSLPTGGA